MAEVDANEGTKRRLPPWMSGVNASDRLSKSDSNSSKLVPVGENLNKDEKDRLETNPPRGDRKGKPRKRDKCMNRGDAEIGSEEGLQKMMKKKKTPKKRNRIDDEIESEKPVRRKKGKSKSCELGNGEEERASSLSGDEEDLTVEDLMSIAEEYVKKADDDDYSKDHRTDTRLSSRSVFNGHESRVSTEAAHASEVPRSRTARSSTSLSNFTSSIDVLRDSKAKSNEEARAIADAGFSLRRTGDPTQDMLDLFLGPLLTKPQVEERKLESVEEDINLHSKLSSKEALQERVQPLVSKKKSSLKDKVTLFLD